MLWAGLLASATFAASAQTPAAAPVPPAAEAQVGAPATTAQPQHKRMDRADLAKRFERMKEMRAKRQAELKDKLALTPAQEQAWAQYNAALQPPAGERAPQQRLKREDFAKMTTPQRLEHMQARQAERTARFAQRADATRDFYAALTPEQQKTFDEQTVRTGQRFHHRGHRHGDAKPAPAQS